ncbi:nucleoside monophosphate kinase [Candidatus Dependentiae bacterium]|nr:nucleoside monophosphate kinase [Candidatus Dependentiae bacterium]
MNRDIFIFLGPPGSGKGSLSQRCVEKLGWQQLSTGNLCRDHIARETEIGTQIDFFIKSGKLISDSLILGMVQEWLAEKAAQGSQGSVIFDGFPRAVSQAHALHELLAEFKDMQLYPIRLVLSDEEVIYRLLARSICQNNSCQRVYSLHKQSAHQPAQEMICDECGSPLVRRFDDEETAIHERLRSHHEHEQSLLDFYHEVGQPVVELNARAPLNEVYNELITKIGHPRE